MKKFVTAVLVMLSLGITSLALAASITLKSADASGVIARITPDPTEVGVKMIHTCAQYGGTLFCRDFGNSWSPYYGDGSTLPDAGRAVFLPGQASAFDFTVTNMDISALVGLQVYVCYGVDVNECLSPGHLALIYTVPEPQGPPPVLHYPETVIGTWSYTWPYIIEKNASGVYTPVKIENHTRYTVGAIPLAHFWIADKPRPDGRILANAQDAVTKDRHQFYIDPISKGLYEDGETDWVWDTTCGWCKVPDPSGARWIDVQPADPAYPSWHPHIQVADGDLFASIYTTWILNFRSATTGLVTVLTPNATFDANGTWGILLKFSN